MQKGRELEKQVDRLIGYIRAMGYHGHKNHPRRRGDGTYLEGEPFDYEMFLPGYTACFDAKETHGVSWQIGEKDLRQANCLKQCRNAGADAFFLIYFHRRGELLRADVDQVIQILSEGRRSVRPEECERWEIDGRIRALAQKKAEGGHHAGGAGEVPGGV